MSCLKHIKGIHEGREYVRVGVVVMVVKDQKEYENATMMITMVFVTMLRREGSEGIRPRPPFLPHGRWHESGHE